MDDLVKGQMKERGRDIIRIERVLQAIAHHRLNAAFILRQWLVGERLNRVRLRYPEETRQSEWLSIVRDAIAKGPRWTLDVPRTTSCNTWTVEALAEALAFFEAFPDIEEITSKAHFLLTWPHYQTLIKIKDPDYREWLIWKATYVDSHGIRAELNEWRSGIEDHSYEEEYEEHREGLSHALNAEICEQPLTPAITPNEFARQELRAANQRAVLEMKEEMELWQYWEDAIEEYAISPRDLQLGAQPEVRQFLDFAQYGGLSSLFLGKLSGKMHRMMSSLRGHCPELALLAADRQFTIDGVPRCADMIFYHVGLHCRVVVNLSQERRLRTFWLEENEKAVTPALADLQVVVTHIDEELKASGVQGDLPTIGCLVTWESDDDAHEHLKVETVLAAGVREHQELSSYQPLLDVIEAWTEGEVQWIAERNASIVGEYDPPF